MRLQGGLSPPAVMYAPLSSPTSACLPVLEMRKWRPAGGGECEGDLLRTINYQAHNLSFPPPPAPQPPHESLLLSPRTMPSPWRGP